MSSWGGVEDFLVKQHLSVLRPANLSTSQSGHILGIAPCNHLRYSITFLPINKPEKATKISRKPVPVTKMAAPKSLPITVYYVALKKSVLEDGRFLIELLQRLCKK
ncbi:hypothetical protein CDAR_321641 [Caerostris darwini]|uniref:Uncharacterized protein n=1 Tax=Caerostris darwini TaxID=1538125 RepID=A0AAV4VTQ2_9ARAC|nr:hypothetical protein CDAR_321641 [Caerostris darwini]